MQDDINDTMDERIPAEYRAMRFWAHGFETAKSWYHEEWDGSPIQLTLARDIAKAIDRATATVTFQGARVD